MNEMDETTKKKTKTKNYQSNQHLDMYKRKRTIASVHEV